MQTVQRLFGSFDNTTSIITLLRVKNVPVWIITMNLEVKLTWIRKENWIPTIQQTMKITK